MVEQSKRLPGPKFMVGLPPSRPGVLPGGPTPNALYMPVAVAERLANIPAVRSYLGVSLKPGESVEAFQGRWAEAFGKASPPVEVRTPAKVDSEVDTTVPDCLCAGVLGHRHQPLAALFIIFTTLSMGGQRGPPVRHAPGGSVHSAAGSGDGGRREPVLGLIGWGRRVTAGVGR